MASKVLSLLLLLLLGSVAAAAGPVNITGSRNITKVLDQFPNFSTFNRLLTQTKVADRINSRQTLTVLAVADSAISSVAALPAGAQEKVLSLHVILDYYDINKITNLPNATAILTTLFQASGEAAGRAGFLNATDVGDGQVKLGSAADGALTSDVVREIAMQPYNLSVIEISQPIVPPGITSSPSGGGNGSTPSLAPSKGAPASPPKASSPAPATADPPVSTPPTPSPTAAPSADAPASSADAPAGSPDAPDAADDKKASSAGRRLVAGAGIGAAMGAAFFLVAP